MQLYMVDPDSVLLLWRRRWIRMRRRLRKQLRLWLRRQQRMRFHLDHPSSVLLLRRRRWILLLIHAEKTFPRDIKTAVRIFRAAVFHYSANPSGREAGNHRPRFLSCPGAVSGFSPFPPRPEFLPCFLFTHSSSISYTALPSIIKRFLMFITLL